MIRLPNWAIKLAKAAGEHEYQALIEYRLSGADVARLLRVDRASIFRWSTEGRQGVLLRCRVFHARSGRPRYFYRLHDVRQFAETFTMPVDLDALHPGLRAEWNVE